MNLLRRLDSSEKIVSSVRYVLPQVRGLVAAAGVMAVDPQCRGCHLPHAVCHRVHARPMSFVLAVLRWLCKQVPANSKVYPQPQPYLHSQLITPSV